MNKLTKAIYLGAFAIGICAAATLSLFFADAIPSKNNENRYKAEFPTFGKEEEDGSLLAQIETYPKRFEAYYNDYLPFRDILIEANSAIDYGVFRQVSNDSVVLGADDWMFFAGDIVSYTGADLLTEEEVEETVRNVMRAKDALKEHGIELILYIPPNKAAVYPEHVPSVYQRYPGASKTETVIARLAKEDGPRVVWAQDEVLKTKDEYPELPLFLHLDTHWNTLGAYAGTRPLLSELGIASPGLSEISYEEESCPDYYWNGYDMVNMLGLADVIDSDTNYRVSGYGEKAYSEDRNVRESQDAFFGTVHTECPEAEDDRTILFDRDSFGGVMIDYLACHFKKMVSPHRTDVRYISILDEKPDVYILEILDRNDISEAVQQILAQVEA